MSYCCYPNVCPFLRSPGLAGGVEGACADTKPCPPQESGQPHPKQAGRASDSNDSNRMNNQHNRNIIEFDGGTSCNIPRIGLGEGYGSFRINGGEIVCVKFGMGHSCNSAEMRTLIAAIEALLESDPQAVRKRLHIIGDSRITLNRVGYCKRGNRVSKPWTKTAFFVEAVAILHTLIRQFGPHGRLVSTEWRGREHSVAIFGH